MAKVVNKQFNSKYCMVCGDKNPFSMDTRFYDLDTKETVAIFHTKEVHQSYPTRLHGGMAAGVLDETIGRAMWIDELESWGVTVDLQVKYKKPIPIGVTLKCVGRIIDSNRKVATGTGEIYLPDGTIAATAIGKYLKVPPEKITDPEFLETDWYLIDGENDPEDVEL